MDKINQFFKKENQSGFSYIEVLIAMAIFAICIIPIHSMLFNASKNAIMGRRYYEAVIMAQNLSEEVKKEIGQRLAKGESLGVEGNVENIDLFLKAYNSPAVPSFNTEFNGDEYHYEVYIKKTEEDLDTYNLSTDADHLYKFVHIDGGSTIALPTPLDIPEVTELKLSSIDSTYFGASFESLPALKIKYDGSSWSDELEEIYNDKIFLSSDDSTNPSNYEILIDDNDSDGPELKSTDRIDIELDVSKLDSTYNLRVRVKNESKANIVLSIYRKHTELDKYIEVFPIQGDPEGNILIERKTKTTPQANYIIRIIIRDRKTSKILKDMIDIYAHDYRIVGGT